jgi:hypothetical protein
MTLESKGKYTGIRNPELKKQVMDQTLQHRHKVEDAGLF